MIGRIQGTLIESNPPQVLVDVHGIGYEVDVPMSTFYNLPGLGDKVTLLTHMVVREDAQLLYGFLTAAERDCFRQLLKVTGIGARTALAILSGMSVEMLVQAVAMQEVGILTKVPGIGKKTAERLILELKDKLGSAMITSGVTVASSAIADVIKALVSLGYSEREATQAAKKLPEDIDLSEGIRLALQGMVK
ncbi:MAG: Holliday junction branch migration protein RuvA [Burkholderiaceae bacterium]|nr:Holliday junction branch migration protein RuvA [Burkholderiaceae bacterium]MBR5458064.1 Holliday junction branch migration protein RuvA [Burkholderiaceae bacterium]